MTQTQAVCSFLRHRHKLSVAPYDTDTSCL